MEVALSIVVGLALVLVGYAVGRSPQQQGPPLVGRTLVVHTRAPDDRTLRGVAHGVYADRISLREAAVVLQGGREQPLDGLQHIPTGSISFVQEIEARA